MKKIFLLLFAASFALNAATGRQLTFEQVYQKKGDVLLQPLPEISEWQDDGHYFEKRGGKILLVNARSGRSQVLLDPQAVKTKLPPGLDLLKPDDHSADYSQLAFLHEDDIYIFQIKTGALHRITATAAAEKNPTFSPDGRFLAFTADGNLFVCATGDGSVSQLTFDGSEEILNGYASWIYYEEILGRSSRYKAFGWSPDSRMIDFMRFDQSGVPQFPLFDAGGAYGRLEMQRYPKAGFPNPQVRIGVIDLAEKKTEWVDFPPEVDHYLTFLAWAPGGKSFYLQWMNRGQEDWRIFEYTLASRELRQAYRELQMTWADAVGSDEFYALADGGILLLSAKGGWSHIYRKRADGTETMITDGTWSVKRIEFVDEKNGQVFFSADKEDSTRSDLYRVSLNGGSPLRLTGVDGSHALTFSPAGSFYLDRYSSIDRPPSLQLCDRSGRVIRNLGASATPAFSKLDLGKVEMFKIPAGDGYRLPAVWYLPPAFKAQERYPVVLVGLRRPGLALGRRCVPAPPRRLLPGPAGDHRAESGPPRLRPFRQAGDGGHASLPGQMGAGRLLQRRRLPAQPALRGR